ncbi:hypothetical protein D3C81_1593890 [compost metagenome]
MRRQVGEDAGAALHMRLQVLRVEAAQGLDGKGQRAPHAVLAERCGGGRQDVVAPQDRVLWQAVQLVHQSPPGWQRKRLVCGWKR